jgi:NAD(P)-dependent dehydrogenase (short-subunit alcohol dehydrogenase family)
MNLSELGEPSESRGRIVTDVVVVIGAGQIGLAIARRVAAGKHVLLADLHKESADAAAEVLADVGYAVSVATVDVSSRDVVHALVETATGLGDVTGVIHAAGVSPSPPSRTRRWPPHRRTTCSTCPSCSPTA